MKKTHFVSFFSLFTSSATLLCCALPATLSLIAGAAAVTTFLEGTFPWIVPLSYYKDWIFLVAAIVLAIDAYLLYRPGRVCPVDDDTCARSIRVSKIIFWISVVIMLIGGFFAYLLTPLLFMLGIWQ